LLTTINKG